VAKAKDNGAAAPSDAVTVDAVKRALEAVADAGKASELARFFKTEPGGYGEGDVFIGVKVPDQRAVAKRFAALPLDACEALLRSPIHEHRLTALLIMVGQFEKARGEDAPRVRDAVARCYLDNLDRVNNWDLVDSSAHFILGASAYSQARYVQKLRALARSDELWRRRVAVISTLFFIRKGDGSLTLELAEELIDDERDLMHKAIGWMLRELGERVDPAALRAFLREHAPKMPRTMLRYAIEKFPEAERKRWLAVERQR
jgi:3-methyladenine DNA glycosylase AlkD